MSAAASFPPLRRPRPTWARRAGPSRHGEVPAHGVVAIVLTGLLLTACAQEGSRIPDTEPLPPAWPTTTDGGPLASMAEYGGRFSLRGVEPDWVGEVRVGQMRVRVAGEPDRLLPLTEAAPCIVRGCVGAVRYGAEGGPTLLFDKRPCRLPSGAAGPYAVTVIVRRDGEAARTLKGCARPGSVPFPGPTIRETPAPPAEPRADTAADARDALDREAAALIDGPNGITGRAWHDLQWLYAGSGVAGRLHDLCTGAVEARPRLSIGPWDWDALDPRTLEAEDRRAVLQWRAQQLTAAFGCGTVFQIGTLAGDARKAAGECPAQISVSRAFVDYVARDPERRRRNDLLQVATEALRAAGCR